MKSGTKLSLVIPCYNEERTLAACVERCLRLKEHGILLELVIVDDCSKDNSYSVAQKLAAEFPEISLHKHTENQGKGAALRTGFLHAHGEYVGIQDADAEYTPMDYLTLLEPLQTGKADVVYGSRYLQQNSRRILYFWHTWMNRFLTFTSNAFSNLDITDMETCYKLFRREVIQELAPKLVENRFGFEPEVTMLVAQHGYRVHECAIHYEPRSYEEGKKIGWRDGIRALYCILHYGAHKAPVPMQFILYFFIGSICAIFNIALFSASSLLAIPLYAATGGSFLLAAALNYALCLMILFKHKARWSGLGEIVAYIWTLAIMGLADYGITYICIAFGAAPLMSKAIATFLGFIGNFILRKYLVF